MDDKTCSSSSVTGPQKASNHYEHFMQPSLLFSDTLMELKNISKQLYSAADYFEISYSNKGQKKQEAVKTLKDYAIKALINTVDHLGTVAYKINSFVDAEIGVISALDLKLSCVEQRLQSCQDYISKDGLSQHSLAAKETQHHKHYMFPVNETINASENRKEGCHYRRLSADNNLQQLKKKYFIFLLKGPVNTPCNIGTKQQRANSFLTWFLCLDVPATNNAEVFSLTFSRVSLKTRTLYADKESNQQEARKESCISTSTSSLGFWFSS